MTVRAVKGDTSARFTDGVWKTGIPSKAGWVAESEEPASKIIPRAIVDLSNAQKERIVATTEPIVPGVTLITASEIEAGPTVEVIPPTPIVEPVKKKADAIVAAGKGKRNGTRKQKK